jgi:MFS family permease
LTRINYLINSSATIKAVGWDVVDSNERAYTGEKARSVAVAIPRLDAEGYPRIGYAWYVVGVLLVAAITSYLDRYLISLLVEPIKRDLLLSDTQISLLQGFSFAVFYVLFGLPFGALVDRGNRRNILVAGVAMWSAMTIACGLASNFTELFLARAGVGIGEACLAPAAYSLIADYFRPNARGRAMSVYNIANYIGTGASLLIGGIVISLVGHTTAATLPLVGELASWKVVFLLVGAPGLLVALWLFTVGEVPRKQAGGAQSRDGRFAQFFVHLRQHPRAYLCVYTVSSMTAFVGLTFAVWGPSFFIRQLGVQPGQVGLHLGPATAIGGVLGSLCSGVLSDRLVRRGHPVGRFLVPLIWWPIALIMLPVIALAQTEAVALVGVMFLAFGSGIGLASVPPTIHDITPNRLRGQATAMHFIISGLLGMGVAPTLIALVTDHVFHDPKALSASLLTVLIPVSLIGLSASLLGRASYATARQQLAVAVAAMSAGSQP